MENVDKIYVVVAVIAIIFVGIVTFLIHLDKKMSRIEKDMKELKSKE